MREEKSLSDELRRLAENTEGMSASTALGVWARHLNRLLENPDRLFAERYAPIVRAEAAHGGERPFLSVITRTMGRRPALLREMLLSLAAQTDTDFELLLIAHRAGEEERSEIGRCLREMPESFRRRTRLLTLDSGNRTAPLNLGFAHARGEYAAVLDDDDLVFDDWVERFHDAASHASGRILHAYIVTQKWELLPGKNGPLPRSTAGPGAECCGEFRFARQLSVNLCPLLGLAFPTVYFQTWGMLFDESLTTTEDWDYLMRLAPLAGVSDIRRPTGLYRLWQNADNSQTLHPQQEWEANYARIQRKFRQMPMLFPPNCDKVERVDRYVPLITPRRVLFKARCRRLVPRPIWRAARSFYRALGGKRWLG